jgi:hypothetical protein
MFRIDQSWKGGRYNTKSAWHSSNVSLFSATGGRYNMTSWSVQHTVRIDRLIIYGGFMARTVNLILFSIYPKLSIYPSVHRKQIFLSFNSQALCRTLGSVLHAKGIHSAPGVVGTARQGQFCNFITTSRLILTHNSDHPASHCFCSKACT